MKGFYLYCIKNKTTKGRLSIAYKDIEAVIREVDLDEFGSEEIAKRAREDIKWITKQAQEHEKVIERAMGVINHKSEIINLKSVIPMKFGTIFKTREKVEDTLKNNYKKFKDILRKLDGKQEWSVKVYIREDMLAQKLKKQNKKILEKEAKMQLAAPGADYFEELEVENILGAILEDAKAKQGKRIFNKIKKAAYKSCENRILSKEVTAKEDPMILNSAYLVREARLKDFKKQVKEIIRLYPECIVECTGPWPAYNFV